MDGSKQANATFTYTLKVKDAVSPPTASPASGASGVVGNDQITLSAPDSLDIYYTVSGQNGAITDPDLNEASQKYTAPITVPLRSTPYTFTIRAIAAPQTNSQLDPSPVAEFTYEVGAQPKAPAPIISPASATLKKGDSITISLPDEIKTLPGASDISIYYTLNGTDPEPGSTGDPTYTTKYVNPIKMAGADLEIRAVIRDERALPHYADSAVASEKYTFFRAEPPIASPATSEAEPTHVQVGAAIDLRTQGTEGGAKIYYTLDNAVNLVPGGAGVVEYTGSIIVEKSTQTYLYVKAITVPDDTSIGQSEQAVYIYRLADLDPAQNPAASPDSGAQLRRGAKILLTSPTLNCDIYYTTDGSLPDADAYDKWVNDGMITAQAPPTKLYSATGIPMEPSSSDVAFEIVAIARERAGKYADSGYTRVSYSLAQCRQPSSIPKTSESEVAVVASGTGITLLSQEANSQVYYTLDGSIPDPAARKAWEASDKTGTEPATKLYTGAIIIDVGDQSFAYINAVTVSTDGMLADSEVTQFTYQTPAPVQAVYATPASGALVKGSTVSLSSATADAKIYYETAVSGTAADPKAYASQLFDAEKPITVNSSLSIKAIAEKDGAVSKISEFKYTVANQLSAPSASIDGGSVVARNTKLELKASSSSTIIYTKDGSDPSQADNKNRLYGSDLVLDGEEGKSMTIRAYATADQRTPSEISTWTYSICKQEDLITVSPPAGSTVSRGTRVSLSTPVTDGRIYYTTDGSNPTTSSSRSDSAQLLADPGETVNLKAFVAIGGDRDTASAPIVFTYTMMKQTQNPTASIPSGAITLDGATVTLTVKEGSIYYTTDGSDPTTSSALYVEPIEINDSMVLKAMAAADDMEQSGIVEYIYTRAGQVEAPSASMTSGEIESASSITLSTGTPGATIYYSTDGLDPSVDVTDDLMIYTGPISITRAVTIKMFATLKGMHPSMANQVTYTVKEQPIPVVEQQQEQTTRATVTDRLTSRRVYDAQQAGPKYEDVIVREQQYNAVVSAPAQSLPQPKVDLVVRQAPNSADDDRAVKSMLDGYGIVSLYDVTLQSGGVEIQPNGEVEIGIPIPAEYQNAIIIVCRINDDGTVEAFPTRRSGGIGYAVVNHFSKYAVVAPVAAANQAGASEIGRRIIETVGWGPIAAGAMGAISIAVIAVLLLRRIERFFPSPGSDAAPALPAGQPSQISQQPGAQAGRHTACGTFELSLGLGYNTKEAIVSEEIMHGLGKGPVYVEIGVEYITPNNHAGDQSEILMGDISIFGHQDRRSPDTGTERVYNISTAVRVLPERGTFQAGVRMGESSDLISLRIRWYAFRLSEVDKKLKSDRDGESYILINPDTIVLPPKGTTHISPVFINMPSEACVFRLVDAEGGSIDNNGVYTAPAREGVYEIRVEAVGNPTLYAHAFAIVTQKKKD